MSVIRTMLARFTGLLAWRRRDVELREEIETHLSLEAERLERSGLSPKAARLAARRSFGGVEQVRERYRDRFGLPAVSGLGRELRLAARALARERAFTAAVVVALGLGIAAGTTIFTLVNGILFRDLPFADPDRVVTIGTAVGGSPRPNAGVSYPDLQDWRSGARSFDGLGAAFETTMNVSDEMRSPERFVGSYVSSNVFDVLGRTPVLGRSFRADDERPGARAVVVLGHTVWQGRYASDPTVIGREIRVNGIPAVVIGVMGEDVGFPVRSRLWQPLGLLAAPLLERRDGRALEGFGRLKAAVSIEQGTLDLGRVAAGLSQTYAATNRGVEPRIAPFRQRSIGGRARSSFPALMVMVGFVLTIACANVANLLLVRGARRGREIALRLAIGASRAHIVRQLLVESTVLAVAGGLFGLALSSVGVRAVWNTISRMGDGLPYWMRFDMDWRVFAFVAGVCLGTGILCGIIPAMHASRSRITGALHGSADGSLTVVGRRRWTTAFVVAQLALTPIVLTGAGLMMSSAIAQNRLDPGVDIAGLVRMRLELQGSRYGTEAQRAQFYRQLEDRFEGDRNLQVALASHAPFEGANDRRLTIAGQPDAGAGQPAAVRVVTIGRQYFDALGTADVRGRRFTALDGGEAVIPAIVNQRFVDVYLPGRDPVGRGFVLGVPRVDEPDQFTVVGVARNIRQSSTENAEAFDPIVYVPYASNPVPRISLMVRSTAGVAAVAPVVRAHLRALDPDLPLFDVKTLDESYAASDERVGLRVFGALFSVFAAIALVLATVGLYAVTAYAAHLRTREIGVRLALGAPVKEIWWLVTRGATRQVVVGLSIGMLGAVGLGQLLRGLLVETSPTDPAILAGVAALLVVVTFAASLVPARRALRIDPVATLRAD